MSDFLKRGDEFVLADQAALQQQLTEKDGTSLLLLNGALNISVGNPPLFLKQIPESFSTH